MKNIHNISPEELERIERFLANEMNAAGKESFLLELDKDASLREKTEEVKLLLLGIQEAALKERLQDFHREIKPRTSKPAPIFSIKKWLAAASVLFAVALSVWWFLYNKPANEKLYSRYYSPDPGLATLMSSSSKYEFDKAMVEYKSGEYDKALTSWKLLLSQNPGNDTLTYFIGVASQAAGKEEQAITNLQMIAADTGSVFCKDACWYLGLAYLKKKETQAAVEYIEKSGYPQAMDIIKDINKK